MTSTTTAPPAESPGGGTETLYHRLLAVLDAAAARYRLIDHPPEGVTAEASRLRRHPLSHAAKCLVLQVRTKKQPPRYVLGVVPGDRRIDLEAVRHLFGGSDASFAPVHLAEQLAGSVRGTIVPFSFHPDLELVIDPAILELKEIVFNAARLDRSIALHTGDYLSLSRPEVRPIAAASPAPVR